MINEFNEVLEKQYVQQCQISVVNLMINDLANGLDITINFY